MAGRFDYRIDWAALPEKQRRLPESRVEKQNIADSQEKSTRKVLATAVTEQALILAAAGQQFLSLVSLQLPPQPSPGLRDTSPSLNRLACRQTSSIHSSEGCILVVLFVSLCVYVAVFVSSLSLQQTLLVCTVFSCTLCVFVWHWIVFGYKYYYVHVSNEITNSLSSNQRVNFFSPQVFFLIPASQVIILIILLLNYCTQCTQQQ